MSTKQYFFLSGIARSGSTLLGSILNQNPDIYVSPTSPLLDLYCLTEESLQKLNQQYTFDLSEKSPQIHKSLHTSFYDDINNPIIIDKHRGWPRNIDTIKQIITPNPKVVATHRPIAENVVSFITLAEKDPNNFIDRDLKANNTPINNRNRALHIWQNYSSDPYYSLQHGLKHHRDNICLVSYDDITSNTKSTLDTIYDFLGLPKFEHTFDTIMNTCAENDSAWGMKDLHTLRTSISKTSRDPASVLDDDLIKFFNRLDDQLCSK